jgi:uncharacterized protein
VLTPENRQIAQQLKAKLMKAGICPLQFIVFGSRARGDHEPYSDMDILIVLEDAMAEAENAIVDAAWEVGFEHNLVVCPIVWTKEQLESRPYQELPLLDAIREQGVAV